jgi:hypothetical protein
MFDINKIINDTIAAAVSTHITTLQQEYANKMAEMAEKITTLERRLLEMWVLEMRRTLDEKLTPAQGVDTALDDRIAALENQALVVSDAVDKRLLALENNPAQGVDTTLEQRVAALETHTAVLDQHGGILEYLDNQEWFWDKIRRFTDGAVEQAMEEHTETYDHSDFVTEDKLDDYITKDNFRDEIEDVLNNATIRVRF